MTKYLLILFAVFALCAAPPQKKEGSKTAALLDINSASEQELRTLPGIGEAYSGKIIAGRPYRAKNELVDKKIVPQATYDKIKDMIVARQSGAPPKKKSL